METVNDLKKLSQALEYRFSEEGSESESVDTDELEEDVEDVKHIPVTTNITPVSLPEINFEIDQDSRNIIEICTDPKLKKALICNLKKKYVLKKYASQLQLLIPTLYTDIANLRRKITIEYNESLQNKKMMRRRLGIPYFKDERFFPCPFNPDGKKMVEKNEHLLHTYCRPSFWSPDDKNRLSKAVYEEICRLEVDRISDILDNLRKNYEKNKAEINLLQRKYTILKNESVVHTIAGNWNSNSIIDIEMDLNKPRNVILLTVANWKNKIDWLKIAATKMNERHSDSECRVMWDCYLNPKVSKAVWTDLENDQLKITAEKYCYQNWEAIAKELNNGKTAYQSCIHFHSKLCDKFKRDKWTQDEDELLLNVVSSCRVGNHISWSRVNYYFKERTKSQIYCHYKRCLMPDLKKGRFSLAEDILLKTLVEYYDNDMAKIQPHFPNRTRLQIRDRLLSNREAAGDNWTIQDDLKIISFVVQHGEGKWSSLNLNRSTACIRHRYNTLKKWFAENPEDKIENVIRRNKINARSDLKKKLALVNSIVNKLLWQLNDLKPDEILKVLSVKHIERLLPDYEREKIKIKEKRSLNSDQKTVDGHLIDFFKTTYRYPGRAKNMQNMEIGDSVNIINTLLNMLGAKLILPSVDKIYHHPLLDDKDKCILTEISTLQNQQNDFSLPSTSQAVLPSTSGFATSQNSISGTSGFATSQGSIFGTSGFATSQSSISGTSGFATSQSSISGTSGFATSQSSISGTSGFATSQNSISGTSGFATSQNSISGTSGFAKSQSSISGTSGFATSQSSISGTSGFTTSQNSIPIPQNCDNLSYTMPPNPETLIGFRGLMLLIHTLQEHAKGKFLGYGLVKKTSKIGVKVTEKLMNDYLDSLDEDNRVEILEERKLFWKRFCTIFSWPCIMSFPKYAPPEELSISVTEMIQEEKKVVASEKNKRGKNYKIKLMVEAKKKMAEEKNAAKSETEKTESKRTTVKKRKRDI